MGKKWTLIALALPFTLGWLLLLFASNLTMLLAGRFLTGFAGGAFLLAAPAYSDEIAEPRYRGALGSLMQLMVTIGILFVNLNCQTEWRLLTGICTIFPVVMVFWMVWMPRSPIFLVSKGKLKEAREALEWLRGSSWPGLEEEYARIQAEVSTSQAVGTVGLMEVWRRREYLMPMIVSLALMALQQLSGIDYILSYSTVIFESSGSTIDSCTSSMLVGAVMVVGTFLTIITVERFGRKILLVLSSTFICLSTLGVAVFFHLRETCAPDCEYVETLGWLPLASLMLFVFVFSVGFGPVPWVMNVELMPPESMAAAASLCTSFSWLVSYAVAGLVPVLGTFLPPSAPYFIFSGIAATGTGFILGWVPETKGKSREQIRRLFFKQETATDREMTGYGNSGLEL